MELQLRSSGMYQKVLNHVKGREKRKKEKETPPSLVTSFLAKPSEIRCMLFPPRWIWIKSFLKNLFFIITLQSYINLHLHLLWSWLYPAWSCPYLSSWNVTLICSPQIVTYPVLKSSLVTSRFFWNSSFLESLEILALASQGHQTGEIWSINHTNHEP